MPQSGFENVLHTNYVPTVEETERILEFCAGPEAEIASLDLEIQRLEGLLTEARQKRDSLASVVKSHRDLLAPIRRLSPELLQTIFAFCLPEGRNTVMHTSEAPLRLRRVSKRWWDIVNNTAEIWASLHIVVPSRDGERSEALRNAAESWLSRSGAHPLRISLYADQSCEHLQVTQFLDVIAPYAERWCRMSFTMAPKLYQYFQQSPYTRHQLPNIRSLELRNRIRDDSFFVPSFSEHYDPDTVVDPLHLLSLTPNITGICCSFDDNWRPASSDEPVIRASLAQSLASKLQELTIDYMFMFDGRLSQILAFLTDCHNLRRLTLCGNLHENDVAEDNRIAVVLPKLEYLALALLLTPGPGTSSHELLPVIFLDYITAPSLLELRLNKGFSIETHLFHTTMTRFLIRSQCPLQTFMLKHQLHHDMVLLSSCLEHVPQLTKLSVTLPYWITPFPPPGNPPGFAPEPQEELLENPADGFLSALCNSVDCCPNLTDLIILNAGSYHKFDLLLSLLRSRAENIERNRERRGSFRLNLQFSAFPSPVHHSISNNNIPSDFRIAVAELEKEYPGCLQVVMPDPFIPDPPSSYAGVAPSDFYRESWEL